MSKDGWCMKNFQNLCVKPPGNTCDAVAPDARCKW